jgi:hypothetical protein
MKRAACLAGLLLFAGCPTPSEPTATWETPLKALPAALLSVWGTAADDVWIVGADAGSGPVVRHWTGHGFDELATGTTGALWWVSGTEDAVWMSGDGGRLLRYDRADMSFETITAPTPERLYGVLPFADVVWTCGSSDDNSAAVIWRGVPDGAGWTFTAPTDLPAGLLDGFACFKVWGPAPDDLWFVGYGGVVVRYQAGTWSRIDLPADRPLFTVHGRGDQIYAVGGAVSGYLLDLSDGTPRDVTPDGEVLQLAGIHVGETATVAAGLEGTVWRREDGGEWTLLGDAPTTPLEYHSVYVDPDGGIWAVGGRVYTGNLSDGLLSHYGPSLTTNTPH